MNKLSWFMVALMVIFAGAQFVTEVPEWESLGSLVLDSDVELQASQSQYGSITIANYKGPCDKCSDSKACDEPPDYKYWDSRRDDFFDRTLEEQTTARLGAMMLLTRGCWSPSSNDGPGSVCPKGWSRMVDAIKRAGQDNVTKIGLFDDNSRNWWQIRNKAEGLKDGTPFDFKDSSAWKYVYNYNWKIFYKTIPKHLWYLIDGKPVIAIWTLKKDKYPKNRDYINKMLEWITKEFKNDFGVAPRYIPPEEIFDSSDVSHNDVYCVHDWFSAGSKISYSSKTINGRTCGAMCPGYRTSCTRSPCEKSTCHEIFRKDGKTLTEGLKANSNATFALLEGWNDVREHAGYYRSKAWSTPSEYINLIRSYSDPSPVTLRLQAETADIFHDNTPENLGGAYRDSGLDVGALEGPNGGWYVGWTDAGEWLQFPDVQLGCGNYRFTVRCSSDTDGATIRLDLPGIDLNGAVGTTSISNTGLSNYRNYHLGEFKLEAGIYDPRIIFETSGINIDWLFIKKSKEC